MTKLIDQLDLPKDLQTLSSDELTQVTEELRDELINKISNLGGHFASSLGAAEITVALHHMFNTPNDRLVWDVGHQCYIHKMLTGRREGIHRIKQRGGPSGFLKRSESEYDCFGAGHAGTSISAAVGMAAALNREHPDRHVVAVIGDGSLTSGMAFEALNHAGAEGLKNLIVVLNDNEMSISPNVGAISWLFSKAVTSRTSTMARSQFKRLYEKGYVPELVYKVIDRAEEAAQGFFAGPAMLFEAFGFRYIGPVDGHSIEDLVKALEHAKRQDVPVLIHAYTVKGKGYEPAEADPVKWHAVKPFDRKRGEFLAAPKPKQSPPSYTKVFSDTLIRLANEDKKLVAITAAMASGTGLDAFQNEHPEAFFDVGICEQHAVTFAAGLACEGYTPFCTIYSTFLQRGFDQVVHDVCIQKLPVRFAMDRAGVVGNDGETHQGVFDISYLRMLPNMVLMSPKDENELQHMLLTAARYTSGPIAVRYPRGNGVGVALDETLEELEIGKAEVLATGCDVLFVCFGPMTQYGLEAAEKLGEHNISAGVVNARFAKPLDEELLAEIMPGYALCCTIEDHALAGGFGSAVSECIDQREIVLQSSLLRFGVGDSFVPHCSQAEQHQLHGYDPDSIVERVIARLGSRKLARAV